jgi:hypothetical protein
MSLPRDLAAGGVAGASTASVDALTTGSSLGWRPASAGSGNSTSATARVDYPAVRPFRCRDLAAG